MQAFQHLFARFFRWNVKKKNKEYKMTLYRALPDDGTNGIKMGDIIVKALHGGEEIPVAFLHTIDSAFPLDKEQLAQNLTDVLNGVPPRHKVDGADHQIFYQPLAENGVKVHWQHHSVGVSRPGLLMVVCQEGLPGELGKDLLDKLTPEAMKLFCDAVNTQPPPEPSARQAPPASGTKPAFNP